VSASVTTPEGITNPPIDELLERAQSKYALEKPLSIALREINSDLIEFKPAE